VIGLKERPDKRDAIALAASLTGFNIKFWDSIWGGDIKQKVLPSVYIPEPLYLPALLRSNILSKGWIDSSLAS
jgi:hypothetical protein